MPKMPDRAGEWIYIGTKPRDNEETPWTQWKCSRCGSKILAYPGKGLPDRCDNCYATMLN